MKNHQCEKGVSKILMFLIMIMVVLISSIIICYYYYIQESPPNKITEKSEIPVNNIQTTTENAQATTGKEYEEKIPNKQQPVAGDIEREIDIASISLAMETYYVDKKNYLQSENLPVSIGSYLNPVPQDSGDGPCSSYQWISNINDSQKYCVWACLIDGKFYVASQKGVTSTDKAPTSLDCW